MRMRNKKTEKGEKKTEKKIIRREEMS